MSNIALRVENLSKKYLLGVQSNVDSLREQIAETVKGLVGRRKSAEHEAQELWALQDVSFEVEHGQVLGIVGHNGAGKSTLLKILSRITRPTRGRIEIYGRISSLLEVGTGFHPELTGRENIYMNAVILGMKHEEIRRKFDEIVDFAGVEQFIDTPVKRYSSGMQVRLAFSVAAHLEPEILIVDEVLAVGDAAFQKKSLGKMGDASRQGRTILFVSHNLGALSTLCPRSILLDHGHKILDDSTSKVIEHYMRANSHGTGEVYWDDPAKAPGNDKVRLQEVRVLSDGKVTGEVDIQKDVELAFEFWVTKPDEYLSAAIRLHDSAGGVVLVSANMHSANLVEDAWFGKSFPKGLYRATCVIPGNFLNTGLYSVSFIVLSNVSNTEISATHVIAFNVYETGAMRKEYMGSGWGGVVRPRLAWQTQQLQAGTD